jgi:hypothetical protein
MVTVADRVVEERAARAAMVVNVFIIGLLWKKRGKVVDMFRIEHFCTVVKYQVRCSEAVEGPLYNEAAGSAITSDG